MKKTVTILLLIAVLFALTACGQKTWTLTVDGVYTIVEYPFFGGGSHFGWQELENGEQSEGEFSISKDGTYSMTIQDAEGKEYAITIINKGGKVEIKADEALTYELKQK